MALGYQENSFVKAFDKIYMEALSSPNLTNEEKQELIVKARSCHPKISDEEDKLVYTFDVSHFQSLEIAITFSGSNKFALQGRHVLPNGINRDAEHEFELPPNVVRNGIRQQCSQGVLTVEFPKIHQVEKGSGTVSERKRKHSPLP